MATTVEFHGLRLGVKSSDGKARLEALQKLPEGSPETSILTYHSSGRLLIIGDLSSVTKAHELFPDKMHIVLLETQNESKAIKSPHKLPTENLFVADYAEVSGHLGEFRVEVTKNEKTMDLAETLGYDPKTFDLVLDLSSVPVIDSQISPPGYFSTVKSSKTLESLAEEISDLIGNFEKPKYFNYDSDICAHSRSGLIGCTRCLDTCPTDAISSIGEMIEVDPYLCQGAGSCASACPTGAITYAYPSAGSQIESIRQVLNTYRAAGGSHPTLLFYDSESGADLMHKGSKSVPENILPIQVEEIGSVGMDTWLAAVAYGSESISLLCTKSVPESVCSELQQQIEFFDAIVGGVGHQPGAVNLLQVKSASALTNSFKEETTKLNVSPANFMVSGAKRTDLRLAIDYLWENGRKWKNTVSLPEGAPFGIIKVNQSTCTLCMACVSVCPASALEAGGDSPKLSFIEWNCVQCGLCESACPENAITRNTRFVYDADERMRSRTLNEDAPVRCISCGKPFATRAILTRMQEKLKSHWMFQDSDAIKRLEMCEDCRVKDMYLKEDSQIKF